MVSFLYLILYKAVKYKGHAQTHTGTDQETAKECTAE